MEGGERMERRAEHQTPYLLGRIEARLDDIARRQDSLHAWMVQHAAELKAHTADDHAEFGRVSRSLTWLKAQVWGIGVVFAGAGAVIWYWLQRVFDRLLSGA